MRALVISGGGSKGAFAGGVLSDVPQQDGATPIPETMLTDFAILP